MKIVVIGRGHVGGGLARLWSRHEHNVIALGRDGGDATDADVVVVAVAAARIPDALGAVVGLAGQPTIDACNIYTDRQLSFPRCRIRFSRSSAARLPRPSRPISPVLTT